MQVPRWSLASWMGPRDEWVLEVEVSRTSSSLAYPLGSSIPPCPSCCAMVSTMPENYAWASSTTFQEVPKPKQRVMWPGNSPPGWCPRPRIFRSPHREN
eukprot:5276378-Pyramimonas_sp.AAC.1